MSSEDTSASICAFIMPICQIKSLSWTVHVLQSFNSFVMLPIWCCKKVALNKKNNLEVLAQLIA